MLLHGMKYKYISRNVYKITLKKYFIIILIQILLVLNVTEIE